MLSDRQPERRGGRKIGGQVVLPLILLVAAIILGGGGSPNPATEILLQILCVVLALVWIWLNLQGQGHGQSKGQGQRLAAPYLDRRLLLLGGLVLAVPLFQLIPLPPAIWHNLPGRETMRAALDLVDAGDHWRPLTLSPARTLASLLSLGPPLLLMAMVGALPVKSRQLMLVAIAGMALATALLGTMQLAGGLDALRLYAQTHSNWITGFQANRNAAADVLLLGTLALAAVMARNGPDLSLQAGGSAERGGGNAGLILFIMAEILLLFAIIMTGSRMGIALIFVALLAQAFILRPRISCAIRGRKRIVVAIAGLSTIAVSGLMLSGNNALRAVAARFSLEGEFRPELWADTRFAITQYWPAGSGMGTFVPVIVAAERLEVVDQTMPNRAHNDYLEILLEAGLPGLVALLAIGATIAAMAISAWRSRSDCDNVGGNDGGNDAGNHYGNGAQIQFGVACLLIIAIHALVDYPLRSMALACLAGAAAGLLARPPAPSYAARHRQVETAHEGRGAGTA